MFGSRRLVMTFGLGLVLLQVSGCVHSHASGAGSGRVPCRYFHADIKALEVMSEQGLNLDAIEYLDSLLGRYRECEECCFREIADLEWRRSLLLFPINQGEMIRAASHGAVEASILSASSEVERRALKKQWEAVEAVAFVDDKQRALSLATDADEIWRGSGNEKRRLSNQVFIAEMVSELSHPSTAERLLKRVIGRLELCYPEEAETIVFAETVLAITRNSMGYGSAGELALLARIDKLENFKGPRPILAPIYLKVAGYYWELGKNKKALSWLDRAAHANQFLLHPCHFERIRIEKDFTSTLYKEGFEKKALDHFDDCVDALLSLDGESCLNGAVDLVAAKGILLGDHRKFEEGERELDRALAAIDRFKGEFLRDYWEGSRAAVAGHRAVVIFNSGRRDEGIRLTREALDRLRGSGLYGTFWEASLEESLAVMLTMTDDFNGALDAARKAEEAFRECCPFRKKHLAKVVGFQVAALRKLGRTEEAQRFERDLSGSATPGIENESDSQDIDVLLSAVNALLEERLPKCGVSKQ